MPDKWREKQEVKVAPERQKIDLSTLSIEELQERVQAILVLETKQPEKYCP